MAIESKHHHASDRVEARVSQATRRDAQAPQLPRFDSYREEYEALVVQKKDIEATLALDFSKGAYSQAQAKLRREYVPQRSLLEWMKLRSEMDRRRGELIKRKTDIEQQLAVLKPKVKIESRRDISAEQVDQPLTPIQAARAAALETIAEELAEVKQLLTRLVDHFCGS